MTTSNKNTDKHQKHKKKNSRTITVIAIISITVLLIVLFPNFEKATPQQTDDKQETTENVTQKPPQDADIIAEYNDERRNSVYYLLGDRFFCFDRNANTTTEIIINKKYEHIQRTFLSPRRSRIFIVVDCGHFAYNRITDGLQLWVLNTYNNNYRKVAEGFAVREEKGNIIVSKGDYCLNSNDRKAIRRWKAKDHIFDYTGKVVWTQGGYEVNEKEIKQIN